MMIKQRILTALGWMAGALTVWSLASDPAHAQRAVNCVNCATSSQAAAINAQLQSVNVQLERLIVAVQGASAANTASTEGTARILAEANAQTAREMEIARSAIQRRPMDPCGAVAAVNGVTGSDGDVLRDRGRSVGRGARAPSGGGSHAMRQAINIAAGEEPAPTVEVGAAMAAMGACESFAEGGRRAEICKKAGFNRSSEANPFPNADVRAETLFDGPQKQQSKLVRRLTISPEGTFWGNAEQMAARAFLRNLNTPLELRELTTPELRSDEGRSYMALRDSYDARMAVAMRPAEDQVQMMTANPNTLPQIKALLDSQDKKFVKQYLDNAYPSFQTNGISLLELGNLEAERRYRNPDWHVRIARATDYQLKQEQVRMQALQIWLTVQMLERLQHLAIIQGVSTGVQVRNELMPQLISAHQAAQR